MQEWTYRHGMASVDNAGVDNAGVGNLNTYVRNSLNSACEMCSSNSSGPLWTSAFLRVLRGDGRPTSAWGQMSTVQDSHYHDPSSVLDYYPLLATSVL